MRTRRTIDLLWWLALVFAAPMILRAQPQCSQTQVVFGTQRGPAISNRGSTPQQPTCNSWALTYWTPAATTSISIELDTAPDNGGVPGTWALAAGTPAVGSNPSTTLQGLLIIQTYAPWVSVNITALGVAGAQVTWTLTGASGISAKSGGGGGAFANQQLSNLSGTVAVNIPLQFSGTGNVEVLTTSQNLQLANSSQLFLQGGKIIGSGGSNIQSTTYSTEAVCSSAAGTCSTATSGHVTIAAAATTVTVTTTNVHTNSVINLISNATQGGNLGVTCNTTPGVLSVSTITNNTSFVITVGTAPATNPLCVDFQIWD